MIFRFRMIVQFRMIFFVHRDDEARFTITLSSYDPATAAEFASWAPAEGDASVARFLDWVRGAHPGQAAPR